MALAGRSFIHIFGFMMISVSTEYYQFLLAQGICSPIGACAIFFVGTSSVSLAQGASSVCPWYCLSRLQCRRSHLPHLSSSIGPRGWIWLDHAHLRIWYFVIACPCEHDHQISSKPQLVPPTIARAFIFACPPLSFPSI